MCRNVKMLFYTPLLPLGPSIRPPCPEYSDTCKPRGYPHTKGLNWFTIKPTFWCPEKQGCVPFWCPEKHSCVPWLFLPDLLTLAARAARPQPGPTCQPRGCCTACSNSKRTTNTQKVSPSFEGRSYVPGCIGCGRITFH